MNSPEPGGVNSDIRALLVAISLRPVRCGGGCDESLLSGLVVVDKLFFIRAGHVDYSRLSAVAGRKEKRRKA